MACYIEVPQDQEIESIPATGYAPFNFPPEGAYLPFFFTDETFTKVMSSVLMGSYLLYGDQATQVRWWFLQNVEYPMSFCEQLIDCLTTDADVQSALANLIATNPTIQAGLRDWLASDQAARELIQEVSNNGTFLPETIGPIVEAGDDLNALFGACTFVTDTIHDAILDFYELFEAATNQRELGEIVFSAIPVIETLPIDEISEYISALEEGIAENFDAQWTTEPITGSRDRIRCALFCAARANGNVLTWDMVETYFWSRVGFTPANVLNVINEFLQFLTSGTWTGQEIVDISFGTFAAAMRQAQKFGNLVYPSMATLFALGLNNPDDDWTIVCEDCAVEFIWQRFLIDGFQPVDTDCGTVTLNEPGHAIFAGGFSYGAYRVQQRLAYPITCFRVIDIDYPSIDFPHSTDCDGVQHPGVPPVDASCYSAMVGASLTPFNIEVWFETC